MITEKERKEAEVYVRSVFENVIHREGKKDLLDYMEKAGFFKAPASRRYHLAEEGGLLIHSTHVAMRMLEMKDAAAYTTETILICALLHDICKMDQYKKSYITGEYEYNKNKTPLGHGEKSVIQIIKKMELTDEEQLAIRWHMGSWDDAVRGGSRDINSAFESSKLAVMLHIADMQATWLDER